jgi:hypothetical protein
MGEVQLLQNILTVVLAIYTITLVIKVARHTYLYMDTYKSVKTIISAMSGSKADRVPFLMKKFLIIDMTILAFLHPLGLIKYGHKWVFQPINLAGKVIDTEFIVDGLLTIIEID